ncbi:MAG: RNA polymerase sigma factor [Phycisphaerae bacterium]|nr:MAG: RNA polymerase sigma factor [Phycisphaerae bacterium]
MTEAEILEGCRRGDQQARHELYMQTSARIHRVLVRITRDQETARDLAQSTYLKAFARISQFDGRAAVATWLHRIAVTEALQYLRKRGRDAGVPCTTSEAIASIPDNQAADVRMDIEDALALLDPLDRTMLLLRYDVGHDYRAIAETLDCAEGTVSSRLNRARGRLRTVLKNSYSSEEDAPSTHQT